MKISVNSLADVDRITPDVVKRALKQMKGGKRDAIFNVQSDFLVNGPEVLLPGC